MCRGFEGQPSLKRRSFKFDVDEKGDHFVSMTHNESMEKNQGEFSDEQSYNKNTKMYKTSSKSRLSNFLLLKLHPECKALFQLAANWLDIWYENQSLRVNKLPPMKKEISFSTNLSLVSTNHSVRATAITLWANAGLNNHEIVATFGHCNESNL